MVCEQCAEGRTGLPQEMACHFRLPRRFFLARDIAWKRTWLDSVLAARARATRRLGADDSQLCLQRALLHNALDRIDMLLSHLHHKGVEPNYPNYYLLHSAATHDDVGHCSGAWHNVICGCVL